MARDSMQRATPAPSPRAGVTRYTPPHGLLDGPTSSQPWIPPYTTCVVPRLGYSSLLTDRTTGGIACPMPTPGHCLPWVLGHRFVDRQELYRRSSPMPTPHCTPGTLPPPLPHIPTIAHSVPVAVGVALVPGSCAVTGALITYALPHYLPYLQKHLRHPRSGTTPLPITIQ